MKNEKWRFENERGEATPQPRPHFSQPLTTKAAALLRRSDECEKSLAPCAGTVRPSLGAHFHCQAFRSNGPILDSKAGHPEKLRTIVRDDGKVMSQSDGRNHEIVAANQLATTFQFVTDPRILGHTG